MNTPGEVRLVRQAARRRAGRDARARRTRPARRRASSTHARGGVERDRAARRAASRGRDRRRPACAARSGRAPTSPREQLLRERRAVVRQVRLGADRDDAPVEALAPERLGGAQPGERGPDDRDSPHARPTLPTGRNPDVAVILTVARPPVVGAVACPSPSRLPPAPPAPGRLDVSGRPLELRDVDLDTFLHPKTIALIGASEQSAKPNTAMTRKFDAWSQQNGADLLPGAPEHETVLGHHVLQVGVRRSRRPRPRDHPHRPRRSTRSKRCCSARPKFAVIFAAGFSETGRRGRRSASSASKRSCERGDVHLLGPNTNLNAFEEFRTDLEGPSIALDHAVGAPGPAGVPGPGDRHPPHALGADRQRGRPRVRRLRPPLRRPARGRRRSRATSRASRTAAR